MSEFGLFLVPVGELERWLPEIEVGVGRGRKNEWATAASAHVRQSAIEEGDVWGFVAGVFRFLRASAEPTGVKPDGPVDPE